MLLTILTARSRSSAGYGFTVFVVSMAPLSQTSGPPGNPARFKLSRLVRRRLLGLLLDARARRERPLWRSRRVCRGRPLAGSCKSGACVKGYPFRSLPLSSASGDHRRGSQLASEACVACADHPSHRRRVGTSGVMASTGKSKTTVWRWQSASRRPASTGCLGTGRVRRARRRSPGTGWPRWSASRTRRRHTRRPMDGQSDGQGLRVAVARCRRSGRRTASRRIAGAPSVLQRSRLRREAPCHRRALRNPAGTCVVLSVDEKRRSRRSTGPSRACR